MKRALLWTLALGIAAGLGWAGARGELDPERWQERLRHPDFALAHVDFVGLEVLDPGSLWRGVEVAPGTPLIDVDPDHVTERIAAHPRVERAVALRLPPGRIVVGVEERRPVAFDEATQRGVDARGERFPVAPHEQSELLRVRGDIERALPAVAAAADLGIELERIDASALDGLVLEPLGADVQLRIADRPHAALRDWLRLRSSGVLAQHAAREIDLRFESSAVLRDFQKGGDGNGSE